MKPTRQQQQQAEAHIRRTLAGKTAPRKPISESKWSPPVGPGPSDNKGIDKALADLMKPVKSK